MAAKTIKVDYLARVEGEGALHVDDPRRRGRATCSSASSSRRASSRRSCAAGPFIEAPDITARICGICPVAYQMSAVHAMEDALGVTVDGQLRALRRLLYCGEWIESHAPPRLHAARAGLPRLPGRDRDGQRPRRHRCAAACA